MPANKKQAVADVSLVSEPLLVPLKQAARLLGVEVYSIRQLTRRGVLPYRVIGNRWLVPYAALKKFAEGSTAGKLGVATR